MALVHEDNWTADRTGSKSATACAKHTVDGSNILIHVVDGFVIKESSYPFKQIVDDTDAAPENVVAAGDGTAPTNSNSVDATEKPAWDAAQAEEEAYAQLVLSNCKFCGNPLDQDRAFWGKRFCSMTCGKRYSLKCTLQYKRLQRKNRAAAAAIAGSVRKPTLPRLIRPRVDERRSLPQKPPSPVNNGRATSADAHFNPATYIDLDDELYDVDEEVFDGVEAQMKYASVPVVTWSTEQVVNFVSSIPGCAASAGLFANEEIDGFALMLLKEEHLVNVMGLKLGPALKIACQLRTIKQEHGVRSRSKYLASPLFDRGPSGV